MDMGFFLQKKRIFPGIHKIGAAFSGPRIADTNFTDTKKIFLIVTLLSCDRSMILQESTGPSGPKSPQNIKSLLAVRKEVPENTREIQKTPKTLSFLSFVFFLNSLFFLPARISWLFSAFLPFFSRDFRGSGGMIKILFFLFGGFPRLFKKNKERKARELDFWAYFSTLRVFLEDFLW